MTAVAVSLPAQVSRVGGTLEGTVAENSGKPIAAAEIKARNVANDLVRSSSSNEQGFFRLSDVPVGTYEVSVTQPGFAPYLQTGVTMTLGRTTRVEIRLSPAKLVQKVNVSAEPSPINPSDTTVTTAVGRERIEELPVRSRNALDFVLLAPGLSATNAPPTGAPSAGLAGSGFVFGGLRPRSNNLAIDGLDNNDEFSGGTRTELSPEIVEEFQVINNGLSAEYGGASGGAVDIVSRTGTNSVHGDAFIFLQGGALNAREPLSEESGPPPLFRYRAGLSRGGPLIRDRTFYYIAAEQEHLRSETASDIDPRVASGINAFLAGGPLPGLRTRRLTEGLFPIARAETEASAKLNHQISERNSLALRYAFTNNKEAGDAFNTDELIDASARGSRFSDDSGLVGSLTSVLSPSTVNDLRFQLARRAVRLRTDDQHGPGIQIIGLVNFGRPYDGDGRYREDHYELAESRAQSRGSQLFKFGGTVNHVHESSSASDGFGGIYLFPTLTDFFSGTPDNFRQAFGNPNTAFAVTAYGSFFQDHWTISRQTTLDLGLRYDFEHLPPGFHQDTNNFSPRIGLAYSPSRSWVLRTGYGIFFDRYVLENLNRAIEKNGVAGFEQVVNGPSAANLWNASGGGEFAQPWAGISPSVYRPDPNLATPYSQQANFEVQYLISKRTTVSANYLHVRGVKLSRTVNSNLLPPVLLTDENAAALGVVDPTPQQLGRDVFGPERLDPRFNDIYTEQDSASLTYNGVSITLERHLRDLTLSASYTVSKTTDDASDFFEQPENPYHLRDERARSLNHQQQRFVLSGLFDLPFGNEEESGKRSSPSGGGQRTFWSRILSSLEVGPIFEAGSGRPVDPLTGLDSNRSDAFPLSSRPLGFGRNTLRTPALCRLDLRLLKSIYFERGRHLDLVMESFNVFNHLNVTEINPFFGSSAAPLAGFGEPTAALNARQIEFSLDFEY